MLTPEQQSKIAVWRARINAGEQLDIEEYKQIVQLMREGRVSAAASSATSRAKKAKVDIPNADDLLDELGG